MGLVRFEDPETCELRWVDTGSRSVRNSYRAAALKHKQNTREILKRSGVDHVTISTNEGDVRPLMRLFKQREGAR